MCHSSPDSDIEGSPLGVNSGYQKRLGHLAPQPTNAPSINPRCRFSLRRARQSGAWDPRPLKPKEIKSGEQVQLFCHSLGLGPFANLDRPPSFASPAKKLHKGDSIRLVFAPSEEFLLAMLGRLDIISGYDYGSLDVADKEAFEKMGLVSRRDFAPGPNVIPANKKSLELSVVNGKKTRVDYKMLQTEPFKSTPLDWTRCRREIAHNAYDMSRVLELEPPGIYHGVPLTVVFE